MQVAQEEIFGPVLVIIAYDSVDEAVEIANDTVYGLGAHVQGQDLAGARAVAARIRSGQVHINYPAWSPHAPFGGYKRSGNGREYGIEGLEEYLETKAILGFGQEEQPARAQASYKEHRQCRHPTTTRIHPCPSPCALLETSSTPPASADVVVIGGGIIGVFTAYYLAKRGLSVAVVEKGHIGAEQSSRNWGWCRQQNRDARELPMATRSLELWDQFAADSGEDTGFTRCGLLYLSDDEAQIAGWAKWREFATTAGVTTHMLSGREASERGQATGRAWKGGVFSPSDGTADPAKAAPAVAAALMKLGGTVHQNCAARGIEMEGGRLSGVVTEAGTIKTRTAVLAGGAWASSFCNQLGVRFPLATIRQSIVRLSPVAQQLPAALTSPRVAITRRPDGHYVLAISGRGRADPTPQLVRFAPQFLPDVRQALAQRVSRRPGRHPMGPRNPRSMEAGRSHTHGTGAHPRPDARPRGCPRNPPPCRRSCCPCCAKPASSTPGRATSTARPTACRVSGNCRRCPASSWPRASRATASASAPARAT